MNLELELLQTFLAVLRHGGFTRAATALHKTQSTVSLHIRRLEGLVGHPLFERQARPVTLTERGELLRTYAETLIALNNEALVKLRRPVVSGTIRLGILEDFAPRLLPAALRRFSEAYPTTRLDVRSALSSDLLRDLDNGDLDLAVVRRRDANSPGVALWREPLLWVAARQRKFSSDPLPLVMFPPGCAYRPEVLRRIRTSSRPWQIVYTSTSLAGVQAAVSAGLGVSVLAQSAVLPEFVVLGAADGLPELPDTEITMVFGESRGEAVLALAEHLSSAVNPSALPMLTT